MKTQLQQSLGTIVSLLCLCFALIALSALATTLNIAKQGAETHALASDANPLKRPMTAFGNIIPLKTHQSFASSPSDRLTLEIETDLGPIVIELFEDAAPDAVAELLAHTNSNGESDDNYYQGLTFDYTKPNVEIRTSRRTSEDILAPITISAEALGLHQQRVRNPGEAMSVMQQELLPLHRKYLQGHSVSPQAKKWLINWYKNYRPDFLIGTTRQTINEALGYRYVEQLHSRPATQWSVMLTPHSKTQASPSLSIALQDFPLRTGKWMVVGRVIKGFDIATQISLRPLVTPQHVKPEGYQPKNPVVIEAVTANTI